MENGFGEPGNGAVYYRNDRIRDAWVEWLGALGWQWFVTYTFADRVHPEAADKKFRLWMSVFQRHVTGTQKWFNNPTKTCRWVRGLEWQKRGVIHYHALLYTPVTVRDLRVYSSGDRSHWADVWRKVSGGFGYVEPVQTGAGALAYLTKYAVKGAAIDISRDVCIEPHTPRPLVIP